MKNLWSTQQLPIQLKVRFFKAACSSILLYGSEAWILNEKLKNSLNSYATNCFRVMLKIKRVDHIPNNEVYHRVREKPLTDSIIKRQLTWVGHMLRRNTTKPIRRFALYESSDRLGTSKLGCPTTSYAQYIANIICPTVRLSAQEIEQKAQGRDAWRKLVLDRSNAYT